MRVANLCIIILFASNFLPAQDSGNQNVDLDFPDHPIIQDPLFARKEKNLLEQIKQYPNNPKMQIDLAHLYQNLRFYPKAIPILESVIHQHPEISEAHFYLGQILGSQNTEPDRSLSELQEAIRLEPERIEFREELASLYYHLQRYPPALSQLDEILKRNPNNADTLYRKAAILYTQGQTTEAESLVDRLPQHEHARVLKAILVQQRSGDAKPFYEAILRDFPNNIRARYEYGKILFNEKQYPAAQAIFEKIIDDDPFYQHAIFHLVKIFSLTHQNAKAKLAKQSLDAINRMGRNERNFYRSYLQHHPDNADTHISMGTIYLEIGRGNLAAQEFKRVLDFEPQQADALFYLAQISMAGGDFLEALPYLEKCLSLQKNPATLHALMAQCYLELKDAPNAQKHLKEALKIDPKDPLANRIQELWEHQSAQKKSQSQ